MQLRNKTASEIAERVLTKLGVSEELAMRVLLKAYSKIDPSDISRLFQIPVKFPLTTLRAQGISRGPEMQQSLKDLAEKMEIHRALGHLK